MASHEYGSVTVGEYKYTVCMYDEGAYWVAPGQKFARAKVLDNTKASYAKAAENVTFNGKTIPVLSFGNTYAGCTNLVVAPEIPSSATNMSSCFAACTSLTTAPTIPASVACMNNCFSGCTALVNPPDMSAAVNVVSMSASFYQCTALVNPPTMPETIASSSDANVYGMSQAFRSCTSLKTAPTIPSGIANMTYCFADCSSLESVPKIPSTVKGMINAFSGCVSLSGSIVVANTPTSWGNMFTGTTNVLYIIPAGDADISTWHTIANAYSNVIFLAEANAKPTLSFSVTRVSASEQTTEDIEGTWAYIVAVATAYYDHLPDGYTNAVGAITLTANGSSTSPTWVSDSIVEGEYKVTETRHTWLQISTIRHVFAMRVVDSYDASSPTITVKLPSTNTLLDFLPGGNGMAIGKVATRDAFDCVIPAFFGKDMTIESGNINRDSSEAPSADAWSNGFFINDADGERLARFQAVRRSTTYNGRIDAGICVYAEPLGGGAQVYNSLIVGVAPDGTRSYGVADKGAFREAIEMNVTGANLPLGTEFAAYNTARTPRYRKQGNVVCLWGAVKPTSNITGDLTTKHTIGTLPSGYRPQAEVTALCQGSGGSVWTLEITTGGVVTAACYRNDTTAVDITTRMWMPFSATFFV